jgi:hypothetical protein
MIRQGIVRQRQLVLPCAPRYISPVPDDRKKKQEARNQKQAGSLGGVGSVAMLVLLVGMRVFRRLTGAARLRRTRLVHAAIVAPRPSLGRSSWIL